MFILVVLFLPRGLAGLADDGLDFILARVRKPQREPSPQVQRPREPLPAASERSA